MKIELPPIIAPASFEEELEAELIAWWRETLFDPLLELFDGDRPNSADDWMPFPARLESLRVPRSRMPQIPADDREALVSFLETRRIKHERGAVLPGALRPTQELWSPSKVEAARHHGGGDRPILVGCDDRILDGHHQWYQALLDRPEHKIDVIVFSAPIRRLLREAHEFPGTTRENAIAGDVAHLAAAINSGTISYADGVFSGKFSSEIGRAIRAMGGTFDKAAKVYRITPSEIPYALRGAFAEARARAERINKGVRDRASEIGANVAASPTLGLKLDAFTANLIADLEEQFRDAMLSAATTEKAIDFVTTPPDFTPDMVADVRETLTENLTLSVKTFTDDEVKTLRQIAEQNWERGGRVDRLEEAIERRFEVTKRKARFLARQETSMVASEFARARAESIGSTDYVWHTRHDYKVRHDHQELNGKTFAWSEPPIVDQARGRRANPGMDYGCRCVARAILNLAARRVA